MRYVLALDQGTTSSRAALFDGDGVLRAARCREFTQIYPRPGWVEHDPYEILDSQLEVLRQVIRSGTAPIDDIAAIGVTNQRETALVWEKATGRPVCNAVVWQCRRSAPLCEQLREQGLEEAIRRKTGLIADAYFSATKLKWILDNIPGARERARRGELLFGTVDSWLIWNLTGGLHVTDCTNASRTMLYNIHEMRWDPQILEWLDIPAAMLPEVRECSGDFGALRPDILGRAIPILGVAGDQQAALFGQACFEPGMTKNTYGTGCFVLMNTGGRAVRSGNRLLTTVAWKVSGQVRYALEGSIFMGGAAVQWLRDELGLIRSAADSEEVASRVPDTGGAYLVPAFAGLGAPWWDMYARGTLVGMTRGTGRAHIVRAALESIAYQTRDVVSAMARDAGMEIPALRADGGASANNLLMQFQADILGIPVERPSCIETTALGAAYLAGLAAGVWPDQRFIASRWSMERFFRPAMDGTLREQAYAGWLRAVERSRGWATES